MKLSLDKLEKKLKIKIQNKALLVEAMTHKSANNIDNNEKFEFLGDRVIGLILSKKLIDLYPSTNEGDLDKRLAKLVNKKTCSSIAWHIGLKDFIITGDSKKKIMQKDEKILSDACEALIGAVYTDRGYYYVKDFVLKLWKNEIKQSNITILDSKTKLQEHSLKMFKKLPVYELLQSKGPKHNPTFKISVSISRSKKFIGFGNSKQEAEQNAASKLLKNIYLD